MVYKKNLFLTGKNIYRIGKKVAFSIGNGDREWQKIPCYSSALQTRFYHGSKRYEPWSDCSHMSQIILVLPIFCPENVVCFFPSSAYIQVHFRPDYIMEANAMNPDQTAPKGSSLIWVHSVCIIGHLSTQAEERVDDKSSDWRQKSK